MGALDRLQAAGFSQQEMSDYASQQHAKLAAGGFSDQEISSYLGGQMGPPAPEPDHAAANAAFAQNVGNHLVDAHNIMNVGTGKNALETVENIASVYGPVEAAMNFVTGAITGLPAFAVQEGARVASILGAPKHITDTATQLAQEAANALTYQPHTEAGQQLAGAVNFPFSTLSNAADVAAPAVQQATKGALGQTGSALTGEAARVAVNFLPLVLGGELARKMGGQRITSEDMGNVAKVVAGPDAKPETVQSVENSLRATYQQTGIGPYTVLEQSRINPDVEADLKNPDVSVPKAFEPYMRRDQVGVPVSDAMKAVRPLEADTPVPAPVPEEAMTPEPEEPSATDEADLSRFEGEGGAAPGVTPPTAEIPQEAEEAPGAAPETGAPTTAEAPAEEAAQAEANRRADMSAQATTRAQRQRQIDPAKDDLMTAIAKLGGISQKDIESQWGLSKKEGQQRIGLGYTSSPKGKSIESMVESLQELGYLNSDDPHGELEEKYHDGLAGQSHFTDQGTVNEGMRRQEENYAEHLLTQRDIEKSGAHELSDGAQARIGEDVDDGPLTAEEEASIGRLVDEFERHERDEPIPWDDIARAEVSEESEGAAEGRAGEGNARTGETEPGAARESGEAFGLTGESLDEARARTAREESERVARERGDKEADKRAKADAERGEFTLTGSDRAADANPNQADIFGLDRAYDEGRGNITLLHSGLSPIEAIQALKSLGQRILQTDIGQKVAATFDAGLRDLQMKAIPMAAGSERAMAVAKDAANSMRRAAWQWGAFDDLLKKGYTKEQREKMWNAADEENDLRTQGITDPARGLGRLTDDERATVETLAQYGNKLLDRARAVGMFQGEGVQFWTPRMIAMIGEDGEISAPQQERAASIEGRGGNVTTSAGSLKGRKHATTAETEAAAKAKFGENAQVVRDIRTMPLAMARIEKAIAGRELVNRIKEVGLQLGQELVSTGEKPEMFTIDHPAFKTYRPAGEQWVPATEAELSAKNLRAGNGRVWKSNPNTVNEYDPVAGYRVTEDGKIERREQIMERAPLYISKEFEGPLKAIMTEKSGPLYQGLMALKGKTMGLIMYSPLIHNMVEWGRALPMMPGKVLTGRVYFEGNAAKHDPVTMRRAIDAGLAPIGHRFFNQDITGLMENPELTPGRSLTAKAVGGAVGLVNDKAGNAVKAAIDKAGDVWHNTLLWDRVADLQMGLFTNLERDMIGKGLDPQTSSRLAAHFANRYAGALPNEAMSNGARKLANLTLFSRTFTLGNIGAMKDMLTGLPQDVQAQLVRDVGEAARAGAVKAARQKALHAFVMDIGLMYVGNAVMQNAMDYIMRDKSIPQILQGYATRFKDYLTRADQDPQQILNVGSIFPQSQNEPGKENRIFYNTAPDGTAVYVRLPTGKIGEEFQGYLTSPLDMLKRKQGTLARPLLQTLQNDKGFGRKVYDDQEPGMKGMLHAVGNVVWNILQEQVPADSIQAGYHLMTGHGDDTDALKTVGPLLGLTFSKGAPGGPEVGVMFDAEKRHQDEMTRVLPDVKELIKNGDIQDAITKMEEAHMTPQEQRATIKYAENPQARLNRARLKKFEQIAPMDDIERMERMQEEESQQSQSTEAP